MATTAGGVVTARSPGETVLVAEYEGLVADAQIGVRKSFAVYPWALAVVLAVVVGVTAYRRRGKKR